MLKILIGIGSIVIFTFTPQYGNTKPDDDCTANLKQDAPREFFSYYKRGNTLLTTEDLVTFYSRAFMDNDQLYYEGPRYSFIAEKHLENMSEGCKTLPMHQGSS